MSRGTRRMTLAAWVTVAVLLGRAQLGAQAGPAAIGTAQRGYVEWEVQNQRDLRGAVQSIWFDAEHGVAYLATLASLYKVRDGKAERIAEPPAPGAQIQLAPGGKVYAWLIPEERAQGMYLVRLMDTAGGQLAELKPSEPPYGAGALILGFEGKLIVTVTPLDDWQGVHGRFRHTFWSRDGRELGKVITPEREIPVAGADGGSLLLLGDQQATAYSEEGKLLWRADGRFRKGAIARRGTVALLNPASREAIDQVHVFTGSDRPAVVKMPTPVHHLRLAPDGSTAVVGGDRGRYFFLDPASGRVTEGAPLPFKAGLFLSDLQLLDRDTLAIGLLQRQGDPPRHTWPRGDVVVVTRSGKILFRTEYPIREPLASRPAVGATFGAPVVIAFTLDTTALIKLGR